MPNTTDSSGRIVDPRLLVFAALAAVIAVLMAVVVAPGASAEGEGALTLDRDDLTPGDTLTVMYETSSPNARNWVGIYPAGSTPGEADSLVWQYVADESGELTWDGTTNGGWNVQSQTPAGEYDVYLLSEDGYTALAGPVSFTLAAPAPGPRPDPLPETGDDAEVRALTWNIYHGGLLDQHDDEENLRLLAEQVAAEDPDIFLAVETYGASDELLAALNNNAQGDEYEGIQITQAASGSDNLWIFTRFPVLEVFPAPTTGGITDFNIGGVRVRMDNNREMSFFSVWSNYTNPWIGDLVEENSLAVSNGEKPPHSVADVAHADRAQTQMVSEMLGYIDAHTRDEPVYIGGDLNTLSESDWDADSSHCQTHHGLAYDLPATAQFHEQGFADAFRTVNPEVCTDPGMTWSPHLDMYTSQRIDFTYLRGDDVELRDSRIIDTRMPGHLEGRFYSDHSFVVDDLSLLGRNRTPWGSSVGGLDFGSSGSLSAGSLTFAP